MLPIHEDVVAAVPDDDVLGLLYELGPGVDGQIRRGDAEVVVLVGGDVPHLVGHPTVLHLHYRRLKEAEVVYAGVHRRGEYQTDVLAFGGLYGTDTAVVGGVDVPHLKGGRLTGKPSLTEGGYTPLVGKLGEGVGLVQELGEAVLGEEGHDGAGDDLRVHYLAQGALLVYELLTDTLGRPYELRPYGLVELLSDPLYTPVGEVVYVVLLPLTPVEGYQLTKGYDEVLLREPLHVLTGYPVPLKVPQVPLKVKAGVYLVPPHPSEEGLVGGEEVGPQELLRRLKR